ncbi:MAG: hypothetical protein LM522_10615 [Candidatus Contendobacter sp.]|nr:hypothetical protein [Candidatus Contendobacter sp.]
MKRWKILLLAAFGVAMSGFFLAIMHPPGGQSSALGQDLPWQASIGQGGAALTVFGLTLGESTVRDAVNKLGRRYELGVFQGKDGLLKLEAYFRDAVVGGLNARLVLAARLPDPMLNTLRTHAGAGKPTADGSRRYPVAETDHDLALGAVVTAITYLPVVKFDAELVRKRFGEPVERIAAESGAHWLYPALGLDLLLGEDGEALLQYVPPLEFEQRLWVPLRKH